MIVALLPAALALASASRRAPAGAARVCLAAKIGQGLWACGGNASHSNTNLRRQRPAEAVAAEARGRRALEEMPGARAARRPRRATRSRLAHRGGAPPGPTAMPQAVSDRMLARVVPFAALPVGGAFLAFVGFWFANTQLDLDITPQIVAYTTQALFLLGFGGITYGVMSTSWDEADEGSGLGLDEAKSNWVKMWGSDDPAAPNFKGRDADP